MSTFTFAFNFFDKSATSTSTTRVSAFVSSLNTFASTNEPFLSNSNFVIHALFVNVNDTYFLPSFTFNTPGLFVYVFIIESSSV